ncbi:MAG: flagellar brake domain-containing protein [Armatimonadetes bacterium]|nr:flagellar brake domain-containing protein [Armatimonadota bacterium]
MQLRVNQRVELLIEEKPYVSRVEEVDGRRIWVSAPFDDDGGVLRVRTRTGVKGRLLDTQGVWEFAGRIAGERMDSIPLVAVDLAGDLVLIESRGAVRHPCLERVHIVILSGQPVRPREGRLLDISDSGARAEVMNPWPQPKAGQQVIITTMRQPPLSAAGEIVWARAVLVRERNYLLGLWRPATWRSWIFPVDRPPSRDAGRRRRPW